ncbi:MAG: helix-turn-helix domain-containing protein [Alphaproteobacteria bacterium]|nr:helix-turn-helix domain-containing protein [Alphaproteobacteria bacterium]
MINIGELSRRTGCNVETVRYYERIGLMPPAPRTAGRYRLYGETDVRRLAFVRRARELGFTLTDVRTLLTLAPDQADGPCAQARNLAAAHLADVRAKIADLRAMERVLGDAVDRCATGKTPHCPVIDALAGEMPRPRRAGATRRRRG